MTVSDVSAAMLAAWEDIRTAPLGSTRTVSTGKADKGGNPVTREVFDPAWVWTCRTRDGHVTKSHWLPDDKRWTGYTQDAGPDLWQPIVTPRAP